MLSKRLIFSIAVILSKQLLHAQSFTVQQAVEFAIQHDVTTQNAAIDREIANKKVNELIGIGLPQINIEADLQKFLKIPTTFVPVEFFGGPPGTYMPIRFGQNYAANAGVSVSQLLFDGSYLVGVQASRIYADLARKGYEQTKIETAQKVIKAYYSALVNEEHYELLKANTERLKKLKEDTKALYVNGFVEKMDMDRVEVAYNNVLTSRDRTQRLILLSKALLKFQMGMEPSAEILLADSLQSARLDEQLIDESAIPLKTRIEYSILETTLKLHQLELKKNRFEYLPSLAAYGTFRYDASRNDFTIFDNSYRWFPTSLIGLKLTLPVFDGLQKRSRIQQSKLNINKIENSFAELSRGIELENMKAQTELLNSLSALQVQKENRSLAAGVARAARIKYEQGVGSNLEVISAETDLREAETNYFAALYQALIAQTDYKKAKGTLLNNY